MTKTRKLTVKQESYKNNRIRGEGMDPCAAYRKSGYATKNMSARAINTEAQRLENHPIISRLIEEAREAARSKAILTREEALQILTANARDKEVACRDKHQAIKQVSSMEGWDAPKKTALTDPEGKVVPLNLNVSSPEVAAALAGLMDKL